MKKILFSIFTFVAVASFAQTTDGEDKLRAQTKDTTLGWKKGGVANLGFSQTSLTNWAAGGESSVAVNGLLSLYATKTMANAVWENNLDFGYGLLQQGQGATWRKTDDRIDLTSKLGKKIKENWYAAGLLNFKTQWTDGFNYPNDVDPISGLMAPGYLILALGAEYRPSDNFSLFLAPATSKNTFVLNQTLSDAGAFGVTPGESFRSEFGGYIRMNYKRDIMENVGFQTKLELFSNYFNNPQNIDVSWETLISMKVNKYISATVGTHLLYDHDINIAVDSDSDGIPEAYGPRVQFKQFLNIGLNYKF